MSLTEGSGTPQKPHPERMAPLRDKPASNQVSWGQNNHYVFERQTEIASANKKCPLSFEFPYYWTTGLATFQPKSIKHIGPANLKIS